MNGAKITDVTACKNKFFAIASFCILKLLKKVCFVPHCKPSQIIDGLDNRIFSITHSGKHKKRALHQGPFSVMKFIEQIIVQSAVH
jgi:hypothetical protein